MADDELHFAKIEKAELSLRPGPLRLLALLRYRTIKYGNTFASWRTIGEDLNWSDSNISDHAKVLKQRGLLATTGLNNLRKSARPAEESWVKAYVAEICDYRLSAPDFRMLLAMRTEHDVEGLAELTGQSRSAAYERLGSLIELGRVGEENGRYRLVNVRHHYQGTAGSVVLHNPWHLMRGEKHEDGERTLEDIATLRSVPELVYRVHVAWLGAMVARGSSCQTQWFTLGAQDAAWRERVRACMPRVRGEQISAVWSDTELDYLAYLALCEADRDELIQRVSDYATYALVPTLPSLRAYVLHKPVQKTLVQYPENWTPRLSDVNGEIDPLITL